MLQCLCHLQDFILAAGQQKQHMWFFYNIKSTGKNFPFQDKNKQINYIYICESLESLHHFSNMLALAWFNIRFTVLSKHSLIDLPLRHRFQYQTCLLPGHQLGFKSSMADRWSHFSQSSQNVQYGLYSNFKLSSWWQTIVDLAHTQTHTQKQTNKTVV